MGTPLDVVAAGSMPASEVLTTLASTTSGLTEDEVGRRRATIGRNAVRSHRARLWPLVWRQLRSPLLALLAVTAAASFVVGERTDAVIIAVILAASVGLGLVNEYRAEQAAQALHSQVSHRCSVRRDGASGLVDVVDLVPGDVVDLRLGEVVPADLRLLTVEDLECEESVLTGESLPVAKSTAPVPAGTTLADLTSCALMGTVVHTGAGSGVVVATGGRAVFGRLALDLGGTRPETEFQVGLRRFSMLLVRVAAVLTVAIFVVNLVLQRPLLDALLFSLAIAVGISPQLLPAVVSTSLAAGSRRLARSKVLVKRLVCIEDLGDVTVLFTDKTGTLTEGRIRFMRTLAGPAGAAGGPGDPADPGADGDRSEGASRAILHGLLCGQVSVDAEGTPVDGNPLDLALWSSPATAKERLLAKGFGRVDVVPFDHVRRTAWVLTVGPDGARVLVAKGAPEDVLDRCVDVPPHLRAAAEAELAAGNRVIAVASRGAPGESSVDVLHPGALRLDGFLVFLDPLKPTVAQTVSRLAQLGVEVKILTGDHPAVAARVAAEIGLPDARVVTGQEVAATDDATLRALIRTCSVFARVSPEDKARIVRAERATGQDVAYLGDGVNDAPALHAADVGVSVDDGTDVAKDAADIILLEKSLDVLADGIVQGRRIFANTIKYVLMGTSSNFGNMFSAAFASALLTFLPMLPSQILLNNLLYDASQLAIPSDTVDADQLARPSHWDVRFIRRFMLVFGPISSLFDLGTFAVMLWGFHADATLFRTGWFVESLATQTLIIFAIRTRRVPFFRSAPSLPLLLGALAAVLTGVALPYTPLADDLGFRPLPGGYFLALAALAVCYLLLIEVTKRLFFGAVPPLSTPAERPMRSRPGRTHRVHRRAARFSTR